MKIILVVGKARSGKNTFCDYAEKRLKDENYKVVQDMFAKYIKGYCKQVGWDGVTKNEYWRTKLQLLGTEYIKEDLNYKSFHAKRIAEDIQILNYAFGVEYFLISDARFKDEIYTLKAMFPNDVITIKINRSDYDNLLTKEQENHKSEMDLEDYYDYDYEIDNNGLLKDFYKSIDKLLKNMEV